MDNIRMQLDLSFGPDRLRIQPFELLSSNCNVYQFRGFQFDSCFYKVAKCRDTKTNEFVAIKIFKKRGSECEESSRELTMLKKISGLDPANIVLFLEDFKHKGYTCLVFEMLDMSLHTLLKERPLSLQEIRPVAQQLLSALDALKKAGIIHTQIKPSNIMLVNQKAQPLRVKLKDFSSAIMAADVKRSAITQPLGYRSPDVILGLPISEAIDMWSLGAVLATLYRGSPLFSERRQYYLILRIQKILGLLESDVLSEGTNTRLYFKSTEDNSSTRTWTPKTFNEYQAGTGFPPQRGKTTKISSLNELVMLHPDEGTYDKMNFASLLRMMLHPNPYKRTTPSDALTHPFLRSDKPDGDAASDDVVSDTLSVSPAVEPAGEDNTATTSDSAASCSGSETVPAFIDEAPDSSPAATDDDSVSSGVTCGSDTGSAAEDVSESTATLTDDSASAEQELSESLSETALTPASSTSDVTVLHGAA